MAGEKYPRGGQGPSFERSGLDLQGHGETLKV